MADKPQVVELDKPLLAAQDIPGQLPILPLSDVVVFPHMVAPLLVSSAQSIHLIDDVVPGHRLIGVTLQTDPNLEHPRYEHLHTIGCVARVARMLKFPDETVRVLIQGLKRMRLEGAVNEEPYLTARVAPLEDEATPSIEQAALVRNVATQFQEIIALTPSPPGRVEDRGRQH